jgi:septal ring factor EnvC (AmiA/AmiB activator)
MAVLLAVASSGPAMGQAETAPVAAQSSRLEDVRQEIARLETELEKMAGQEQGLIGELDRLGAEYTLRQREREQVQLRLEALGDSIATHDQRLAALGGAQEQRRRYLAFRLREIYKNGADDWLRRVVEGESVGTYWSAVRYASYLSQRDREVLEALRGDENAVAQEVRDLESAQSELLELEQDLDRTQARLVDARAQRASALERLREDQASRREALVELEVAARQLTELVDSFPGGQGQPELDIRKFKGLLEWPADGVLTAGFGTRIHPRFRTEVPHPGWDIDAPNGSRIRTVFDGSVVYAAWMRGYGLTAIVDHGHGVLSIYAHAAVLLATQGERVVRGQVLGLVGETGSLRGPYLYFELRDQGEPVDPGAWLRER